MELIVTGVDYAPAELDDQVPFEIKLIRILPGPDRLDYWLGQLASPLFWLRDNQRVSVDHLVIAARWQGTRVAPLIQNLAIGIAYVTDLTLLNDSTLDFSKCQYVAIGIAHETSGNPAPKKPSAILAGTIAPAFGLGKGS
jgi:hypothetical protein